MGTDILVTGGNGQLAIELKKLLPNAHFADRADLDITNKQAVLNFVKRFEIRTIINCAAYTAVDKAEDEEEQAYLINAIGPENLSQTGCRLIHFSTDYVFDGKKGKPYLPDDDCLPLSAYGRTKREGEIAALKAECAAVIRTSWLYSAHGKNFVKTIYRLGHERDSLKVVADQIGSPTFAGDLAAAAVAMLSKLNADNSGIYHYADAGNCSWFEFALEIMRLSGLKTRIEPIPAAEYPSKVYRPSYSVLDCSKIKDTFGVVTPSWKTSLAICLKQF